ncbi:hypothetical protein V1477_015277 [Vespula maculifrons]|uniref:Uncharacterized protein n=1 Tax=Vespula maculifrons TaxID=7453 RepID=A0ABD2BJU6_VESMC
MKLSFLFNELTAPFSVEAERSVGGGAPGSAGAVVGGPQVLAASPAPSTPTTPAATSPSASSPASSVSSSPSPSSSPTSALLAGLDKSVLQGRYNGDDRRTACPLPFTITLFAHRSSAYCIPQRVSLELKVRIRDWLTVEEEMLRQQAVVVGDVDEIIQLIDKQKNVLRELEQKKPQLDELVHTAENLRADTNRQQLHGKGKGSRRYRFAGLNFHAYPYDSKSSRRLPTGGGDVNCFKGPGKFSPSMPGIVRSVLATWYSSLSSCFVPVIL